MAYIKGLSYYLPERVVTNEELLKEFPEWSVDKVAKKVGVNSRHLAAEDETAGDMAEKAARKLFEEYNKIGFVSPERRYELYLENRCILTIINIKY